MIVDFHIHIFSESVSTERERYLADRQFNCLYKNPKSKIAGHAQAVSAMNEAGIDYSVAMGFPWDREDFCAQQNEYLRSASALSGGKILSFGSVPLNCGEGMEAWVGDLKAQGFSGIGEVGFYRDGVTAANMEFTRRLIEAAQKHSLPVCLHVNEPVGHWYSGKYRPELHLLYSVLADYPGAKIILSHWGGGLLFYELMREVSAALENCYYDTAATPLLYSGLIYEVSLKIIGSKRILYGSDYPLLQFDRYFGSIEKAVADNESKADIMGNNAVKLLNIR
jgi:predicted TIM-barrel fold metal-dependent hydrolase